MKSTKVLYSLAVVVALLVATILVACAPPATPTEVAPSPAPAEPSTLVVAIPGDVASLDVHQLFDPRAWPIARAIYGGGFEWELETDPATGLTYVSEAKFRPGLLESWESKEENGELVYTCHIRQGCKFASGNEMTAEDFKYRIARINALSEWDVIVGGCTKGEDCVTILDDYTFEMHLDEPNAVSERWMEELTMMVVDSEELKKEHTDEDEWAHEYMRSHALGVGAYNLDHITPGVEILLVKNEDYCAPDYMQGYFDRILFKIIPSVSDQMLLLKKGEIDLAPELPIKEVLDIMDESGIEVLSFDSMNLFYLGFNVHLEPFDNVKVRQALAYAVPYDDIVDVVFLGQAQKPTGLITSGTAGATDKYWIYEYDLDKAKSLLAEAGYPDGFDMDLHFDLTRTAHEDAAVLIKDAFAKIGVNVNLIKESPAAFGEKLYAKEAPSAYLTTMLAWTNDAGYTMDMAYSSWGFANFGDWVNDELEQLIKEAWMARDPEVRLPMYDRAQEILDTELPVIALCQPNYVVAMKDDIKGYLKSWDELPRYHRLYTEE